MAYYKLTFIHDGSNGVEVLDGFIAHNELMQFVRHLHKSVRGFVYHVSRVVTE